MLCKISYYPPATKLGQGYIFAGVCHSVNGGVLSQHALQVVSEHALQQVSGGGVLSQHALQVVSQHTLQQVSMGVCSWEGLLLGGCGRGVCSWGGICSQGGVCSWGCGLLLWPSVVVFCYGLLVRWPSD